VLTSMVGTLTAVDCVTQSMDFSVQRNAYALLPARKIGACPSTSSRHRKSPIGTGSFQDHANESERSWLQGVALAFFSQVAGSKLTEPPVHERRPVVLSLLVTL
jgi:hypothetical protein